jgi:hypothetical protein
VGDPAAAVLGRHTIEAMKMLISRSASSKAAASAISNDEAAAVGRCGDPHQ